MNSYKQLLSLLILTLSNAIFAQPIFEKALVIGTYHYSISSPFILTNKNNNWVMQNLSLVDKRLKHANVYALNCFDKTCMASLTPYEDFTLGFPLFLISHDEGATWTTHSYLNGLPDQMEGGRAEKIYCDESYCFAAGSYQHFATTVPLLLLSHDKGQSWSFVPNIPLPVSMPKRATGSFNLLTCNQKACVLGGAYRINQKQMNLMMFSSQDEGQTWQYSNVVNVPKHMEDIRLKSLICHHQSCLVVGTYHHWDENQQKLRYHILLLKSEDGGLSWRIEETPSLSSATFLSVNDLAYFHDFYILVGSYANDRKKQSAPEAFILEIKANGVPEPILYNKLLSLNSISCTQKYCIAGGETNFYKFGFLKRNVNNSSWSWISASAAELEPTIDKIRCKHNACIAFAHDKVDEEQGGYENPHILTSNDQGESWAVSEKIFAFPNPVNNIQFLDARL
ncbi:MAG: exo-alpha-sialidase [Legionella longbeachae]|nr:exo-alpha-sialidase [Legionella longbeachae]